MIQVHHIYCVLYFYYYYINSTSDHQALDSRRWGPQTYGKQMYCQEEDFYLFNSNNNTTHKTFALFCLISIIFNTQMHMTCYVKMLLQTQTNSELALYICMGDFLYITDLLSYVLYEKNHRTTCKIFLQFFISLFPNFFSTKK